MITDATQSDTTRFAFIVGAPRCGTTFLARHLRRHPEVCFSRVKEPHFFSACDLRHVPEEELNETVKRHYLDRFFPGRSGHSYLAEGSVTYLYAPEQLEPVLKLWPDAKFVVAVRDPMQMVPSLHQRLRWIGDETVADFERAWALVDHRREGRLVPSRCIEPRLLDYWESGRHGHYLARFFSVVGRERCFVSLFDDLVADPAREYRRVLEFLDLPDDKQSTFEPARESLGIKLPWLQRLLKRPPGIAVSMLAGDGFPSPFARAPRDPGKAAKAILSLRKRLIEWNKAPAPSVALSQSMQAQIRSTFHDDVRLLESLISRDLGHWLRGPLTAGEVR